LNASDLNDDDLARIEALLYPLDLWATIILATMLVLVFVIPAEANPFTGSIRQFLNLISGPTG
jgi:type II secretory pathway component PulF